MPTVILTIARRLLIPALLLLVVVGFYWRLVLTDQYTWLHGPDYCNQVLPWYQFEAGEWHQGRIPLWDPYEFAGQSIIGQGQPGVADPLNLPLFWWPLSKTKWIAQGALHWFYVLPHWIAALGFFALCRELGRSRLASFIAACLYALGGISLTLDWPQMHHATVWAPLIFCFQFRALRGERPVANGILSGLFLGFAWLAGHHQIPIYFSLTSAALWIYSFFTSAEPAERWKIARAAIACGLFLFLVSAVQTLPAFEYGRNSLRWVGAENAVKWNDIVPYYVHGVFSMNPLSMLGIVLPGFDLSYSPHVGFVAALLGLFGMITNWQDRSSRILTAIAVGGFVYSLGDGTPFEGLLYAIVPMVEKARVPAIAQILFDLGLCGLAAAGIDRLQDVEWAVWRQRLAAAFGVSGLVILLTALGFTLMKILWPGAEDRWVFTGWLTLGAWLVLRRRETRHPALWLALIAICELSMTTVRIWENIDQKDRARRLDALASHTDLAEMLRSRPGAPRMSYSLDDIEYSFGDWWGLETLEAMVPSTPWELWRNDVFSRRVAQLLGVRFYAGKKARYAELPEYFVSRAGIHVWEDRDAMPRLWTVHKAFAVKDLEEARKSLQNPATILSRETMQIGKAPQLATCDSAPPDRANFVERIPNRIRIEAELGCRGMVIVNDLYDANWVARVDGKDAPVEEAYALVRGVVVEAGRHSIEMVYRPKTVLIGAALTAIGLLGAALAAIGVVRV